MTHHQKGYHTVRKAIHDPEYSTRDVRRMLNAFVYTYSGSSASTALKIKFFWHRVLNRFKATGEDRPEYGMETVRKLQSVSPGEKDRRILLVSHEMSNTGAPRALLSLGIALRQNGYEPIILTYSDGPLTEEAEAAGIGVVMSEMGMKEAEFASAKASETAGFISGFRQVVVNTLVAMVRFPAVYRRLTDRENVRMYAWIHEAESVYVGLGLDKMRMEEMIGEFDDIWIVGERARTHARKRTPLAVDFKNFFYLVPEVPFTSQERRQSSEGPLKMMLAGSLEPQKGHKVLLEALRKLTEDERAALEIHLMGKAYDKDIADAVREYPGKELVYHGPVPHDELMRDLSRMDMVLCPSIDDCMPIICSEAFQLNVPVLVSDATGTAAFIEEGKNGFIVKSGDSDSLASALRKVLAMRNRLPEIGKEGHKIYSDNFSEAAFLRQISHYFPPIS